MSKKNQTNIPFIYTSILYIAGLLLFLEWLYPVDEVTDTVFLGIFVIYTIFCFFISILQVKWWLSLLLKGFGVFFILNGVYSDHSFWSKHWFTELFADFGFNIQALFARQWFDLSNMFRTLLFLIIIWLMSYLIYYWFVQIKRVMIFSVLTFVYITLLDTFTVYNADWPIIRTFVIAFLALGIANVLKEIQSESLQSYRLSARPLWILPLVAIVLFSSVVGYAAPKLDPQWPDPVPFLENAVNGDGIGVGGVIQKVGYGENDSTLGGSFVQDYTPVFKAFMQEENYFRVESKDYYTGKGWVNSDEGDYVEQVDWDITFETFSSTVESNPSELVLTFDERANIPKLIYPYGARHVVAQSEDVALLLNEETGEIRTEVDDDAVNLRGYSIKYNSPSYPIDLMRNSGAPEDEELVRKNTRLPNNLPDRVGELAKEITANHESQYDKVRAIERYFSGNGFVYQIEDVPVPTEEQDYVDQFLFDTKAGYCDNFSTSMVVMLRSLDIPARWVKGFTSGEKIEEDVNELGDDVYEVTNANAHSWVEVYFEGVGWVPFEPTQGFDAPNNYAVDTSTEDDLLEAPEAPEMPEQDLEKPEQDVQDAFNPSTGENDSKFEITKTHGIILAVIFLVLIGVVVWKRHQLRIYFLERKMQKRKDAAAYQDAYHYVLRLLRHKGFQKDPDQTLREYAMRVDNFYSTDEMGRLTTRYERLIYQNGSPNIVDDELSNLWKNLIKKILG
ncbi:transglutaminaseTgpA domain-containing protein [Paucisalibacillus sp. EB02]|uniref:transglutaminaseTgpA domain-containing protein n=1 Tax=Paucisalibacillus sp. EB02 TaxID=1347087 RepID=UPI0004B1D132|nr:transglutaminaseTgpA domain-containing protein [Paucisalibacillus sp. EB02]